MVVAMVISQAWDSPTPPSPEVRQDEKISFLLAIVLTGTTLGQLAFHLRTGTKPSGLSMPLWFNLPMSIALAATAVRWHGLARPAFGLIALSLVVPDLLSAIGVRGWAAWAARNVLAWVGSLLLLVDLRRSARVRVVTVAAAVVLVLALTYSTQLMGYNMWLRANKQNSVMRP